MDFLFFTQAEVKDVAPLSFRQPVQCSDQAISCACSQEKLPVCLGGPMSQLLTGLKSYLLPMRGQGYDMWNEMMNIQRVTRSRFVGPPPFQV